MARKTKNILRTSGGQLAETSTEELSQQAGRDIQPLQPLEASVLGGNPDQAKMVGSSAQKLSAVRQSLRSGEEESDLRTRLRRQQTRTTATESEKEKLAKGERLENLGQLEDRVDQLAEERLKGAFDTGTEGVDRTSALAGQSSDILQQLSADPDNPELIKQAAQSLNLDLATFNNGAKILEAFGFTKPDPTGEWVIGEDTQDKIASKAEAIAEGIDFTLTNEDVTALGFSNSAELAELLQVSEAELLSMNPTQIVEHATSQLQTEFSQVDSLQQQANDPFLGAAERAEARKELKGMGAVGIRSIESDMDNLADEIANDNMITFGGEEITIEQLLDDDKTSALIANYFLDPDYKETLEKQHPELASFVKKHESVLEEFAKELDEDTIAFGVMQDNNAQLGVVDGQKLPDSFMQSAVPGWGELSSSTLSASTSPVLMSLKGNRLTSAEKAKVVESINLIEQNNPEMMEELATLDPVTAKNLGLTDGNQEKLDKLAEYLETKKQFQSFDRMSTEEVLEFAGITKEQAMESAKLAQSGMVSGADVPFEIKQDGTLDVSKLYSQLYKDYVRTGSLGELGKGLPTTKSDVFTKVTNPPAKTEAYNIIEPYLTDGVLTLNEVNQIAKGASLDTINKLHSSPEFRSLLGPDQRSALNDRAETVVREELLNPTVQNVQGSNYISFDEAMNAMRTDSTHMENSFYNPASAERAIANIDGTIAALEEKAKIPGVAGTLASKELEKMKNKRTAYRTKLTTDLMEDKRAFIDDFLKDTKASLLKEEGGAELWERSKEIYKNDIVKKYNKRNELRKKGKLTRETDKFRPKKRLSSL